MAGGEIEAGRLQPPSERDVEGPAISISLGDARDVDPGLLAAMCGPEGLGGEAASAMFVQDRAADVLRPGPVLAALTAQTVARLDALTDNELIGVLQASRRMAALVGYQQTVAVAEFARRREAAFEAAKAAGRPVGCRAGEFPGEELAAELVMSPLAASTLIDEATELVHRLPQTLAAMATGKIDPARAGIIAAHTQLLTDRDAACVDEELAAAAPGKRLDQLARKAAALEMKLAPEAVRERKERARREGQRVEVRRDIDHAVPWPDGATCQSVQHGSQVQKTPPCETGSRMESRTASPRHHQMDLALRPHSHHWPDRLRPVT